MRERECRQSRNAAHSLHTKAFTMQAPASKKGDERVAMEYGCLEGCVASYPLLSVKNVVRTSMYIQAYPYCEKLFSDLRCCVEAISATILVFDDGG